MTYQQTLEYLYAKLPMFTNLGASAIKKDLTNTIAFCESLDNPQNKFKTIHVAGTNGKGSTSHMLAAILQTAGYKTGLYTSPHLKDFRERIKINGQMISELAVTDFVNKNLPTIEKISPSFFEVTVAMAFQYFAEQEVDIAVIEVGLGGRLDSTNIIHPEISVITNIGYDHMDIPGNTLEEIAGEKAGIIKPKTPVIIGEYLSETKPIFLNKANLENAPIQFAQDCVEVKVLDRNSENIWIETTINNLTQDLVLDLTATYQLKNIKTVLVAVNELRKKDFHISDEHIKTALKGVKKLTGLMGRWQLLQTKPLIICDNGHNEDGIKEVLKNIALTPYEHLHIVLGMVKDKDSTKILKLLPAKASYYFCAPKLARAKPVEELKEQAATFNIKGLAYADVTSALAAAKQEANSNDLIFIGGSTFVVAEVV